MLIGSQVVYGGEFPVYGGAIADLQQGAEVQFVPSEEMSRCRTKDILLAAAASSTRTVSVKSHFFFTMMKRRSTASVTEKVQEILSVVRKGNNIAQENGILFIAASEKRNVNHNKKPENVSNTAFSITIETMFPVPASSAATALCADTTAAFERTCIKALKEQHRLTHKRVLDDRNGIHVAHTEAAALQMSQLVRQRFCCCVTRWGLAADLLVFEQYRKTCPLLKCRDVKISQEHIRSGGSGGLCEHIILRNQRPKQLKREQLALDLLQQR